MPSNGETRIASTTDKGFLQVYYSGVWYDLEGQPDPTPPTLSSGGLGYRDDGTYLSLRWRSGTQYWKARLGKPGTLATTYGTGSVEFLSANKGIRVGDGSYWFTNRNYISTWKTSTGARAFDVGAEIPMRFQASIGGSIKIVNVDEAGVEATPLGPYTVTGGVEWQPSDAGIVLSADPPRDAYNYLRVDLYSTTDGTGDVKDRAYFYIYVNP